MEEQMENHSQMEIPTEASETKAKPKLLVKLANYCNILS